MDNPTSTAILEATLPQFPASTRFVLCRPDKVPARKWKNRFKSVEEAIAHARRGGLIAVEPWSIGLAVIDIDKAGQSKTPGQDVQAILGEAIARNRTRGGGWHLWYKPQKPCANASWELENGAGGDIRCQNGYVILWDPTNALVACVERENYAPVDLDLIPRTVDKVKAKTPNYTEAKTQEKRTPYPESLLEAQREGDYDMGQLATLGEGGRHNTFLAAVAHYWATTGPTGWAFIEPHLRDAWNKATASKREGEFNALVKSAQNKYAQGDDPQPQKKEKPPLTIEKMAPKTQKTQKEGEKEEKNGNGGYDWAVLMRNWMVDREDFVWMRGAVHEYDPAVQAYRPLKDAEVRAAAGEFIEVFGLMDSRKEKPATECRRMVSHVPGMLTRELKRGERDNDQQEIPMATGVFDVASGQLRPYGKDTHYTLDDRGEFDPCLDEGACADAWNTLFAPFLIDCMGEDVLGWTEQYMAHVLFDNNIHQRICEIAGPAGTGKDTYATLMRLLANGAPLSEEGMAGRRQDAYLKMIDKRLVQLAEPNIIDALTMKKMSGWSPMVARALYREEIDFVYKGHLMVWGNLDLDWTAEGMARRLVRLRFDRKPPVVDPMLGNKLEAKLPQAFGYLHSLWQEKAPFADGFWMPEKVMAWSEEATRSVDSFQGFVDEYIDTAEDEEISVRDVVYIYAEAMQEQIIRAKDGSKTLSDRVFDRYSKKVRREAMAAGLIKARHGYFKGAFK